MPSSRGSSQPRDQIQVSHVADGFFTLLVTWEATPKVQMPTILFPLVQNSWGVSDNLDPSTKLLKVLKSHVSFPILDLVLRQRPHLKWMDGGSLAGKGYT